MRLKHGGAGKEGLETKNDSKTTKGGAGGGGEDDGGAGGGGGDGDDLCPKDCSAVESLRKRLTTLIENATKLQNDVKANNDIIMTQQRTIDNMQRAVQKLVETKNKKK